MCCKINSFDCDGLSHLRYCFNLIDNFMFILEIVINEQFICGAKITASGIKYLKRKPRLYCLLYKERKKMFVSMFYFFSIVDTYCFNCNEFYT